MTIMFAMLLLGLCVGILSPYMMFSERLHSRTHILASSLSAVCSWLLFEAIFPANVSFVYGSLALGFFGVAFYLSFEGLFSWFQERGHHKTRDLHFDGYRGGTFAKRRESRRQAA